MKGRGPWRGSDLTPEEVEGAILVGLRYLEREARTARLTKLAETIGRALKDYATQTQDWGGEL